VRQNTIADVGASMSSTRASAGTLWRRCTPLGLAKVLVLGVPVERYPLS
jgi:hypothetical protein